MRRTLGLFLAGLILASPAWCGTGSYTAGDPDLIQLNVRFHNFNQSPDPRTWEPLFKAASSLLFDATQGQVKISKVIFNQCPGTASRADVLIFSSPGRALTLGVGGFGTADTFMRLTSLHQTVSPDSRGDLGLVHEIGHYVFGLLDEYKDKEGRESDRAGCAFQSDGEIDPAASIMDSGTRDVRKNSRTEFCVASNHHTGQTEQDSRRFIGNRAFEDTDGWTWLVAWVGEHYGSTLEPPPPSTLPRSGATEFQGDPAFEVVSCGLRLSLGIDSSEGIRAFRAPGAPGAPPSGTPIDVAKEGSRKLIQLLDEGDTAGIVAVGGETDAVPMRMMSTDNRSQSLSDIRRFEARGRAGWAKVLRESYRQVGGAEASAGNKAIVLISDGSRNGVEAPDDLLSAARERGVIVHTIGIGKESTELRRVAEKTGGRYRLATTAAQVNANLLSVLADVKSRGILAAEEGRLEPGKSPPITVHVDTATWRQTADFLLAWSDTATSLEMTLEAPDGTTVSANEAKVVLQDFNGKLKRYRIFNPAPGNWKVTLTNPGGSSREFAFQAHSWTDAMKVAGYAIDDVVSLSEPLVLKAAVSTHLPVAGAKVVARIESPDGTPVSLELFDDGSPEHRDERANDGFYSNVFEDYAGAGTYTVDLKVDSEGGRTVHPEDADYVSQDVLHRFVRTVRFSAMVQGDPDE